MEILKRNTLLVFLLVIGNIYGQHDSADSIYSHLDAFLEMPSPENLYTLQNALRNSSSEDKKIQVAKTIAYCNIGYVHAQEGDFQKAIDFYERAKQLYFSKELIGYDIIEYCLKPLGNLYIKIQAFAEAENTIKHYILLAKKAGKSEPEIAGFLNLSVLYHNRGEFKKAKNILLQALAKDPLNQDLQLNLANANFALGQVRESKNLLDEIISRTPKSVNALQLLAQIQLKEEEYDRAISTLKKAINTLQYNPRSTTREKAKLYLSLSEAYVAASDPSSALMQLTQVYKLQIPGFGQEQKMPVAEQLYPETVLMDALDLQGQIAAEQEKTEMALKAYEMASTVNQFLLAQAYLQDSKLIVQQNDRRRSEQLIKIFYRKYQATKNRAWLEKAIVLDARAKGSIILDAQALKEALKSKTGKIQGRFQTLRYELSAIANKINEYTAAEKMDMEKVAELQSSYSNMLSEQRMLYDSIRSLVQNEINFIPSHDLLDQIQKKSAEFNQIIVSYFMGSEELYQFVISGEKIQFNQLAHSEEKFREIREAIRKYNRFFDSPSTINNDIETFKRESHGLYRLLKIPQSERLVIIPDGILAFVPFQTLLTESTETWDYSEMPFLSFTSPISYLLSLREYTTMDKAKFGKEQSVLGVFPVFKNSPEELGYSVNEAAAIQNFFNSEILLESEATRDGFLRESTTHSILHLSTHAMGGTFYEDASIRFYDGVINIEEIYGHDFSAELVVLSACETGVGKVVKGEGALGLARAFQYSGAENVLFSLWQVNDRSTAHLMEFYYSNLQKSHSRDFSLHTAILDYLGDDSIDNTRKSPYYWGAFVHYGTIDIPQKPSTLAWIIIGCGMFIGIGVCFLVYMRCEKGKGSLDSC